MASPLSGQIHYNQLKNSIVMINKLRPHAAQLLVALKKTIPAVILLGSLSLATAPVAQAQITFSVDSFTTDELVITLTGGSTLTGTAPGLTDYDNLLSLHASEPSLSNLLWYVGPPTIEYGTVSGSGLLGSATLIEGAVYDYDVEGYGDFIYFTFDGDLVSGTSLSGPLTLSLSSPGNFVPTEVTSFTLYWGDPYHGFSVQSFGPAVTGGGSAVPEPGSFALILGLAALCFCGSRRRASLQRVA